MRKRCLFLLAGAVVLAALGHPTLAEETTAGQIVAFCAEAMGGRGRIDALETMRLTMDYPDHATPIRMEIKRPNRSRNGETVVFDGRRAALLARALAPGGAPRPAELVPAEEWKDFEVVIGFHFPAFFDHPSEYLGVEHVEGIRTHKLGVTLPLGGRLIYFIDAATGLPLMVESDVTMGGLDYRSWRIFTDYRETEGILYPHAFTYFSPKVRRMFTVSVEKAELNVPLDDARFRVPAGLPEAPGSAVTPEAPSGEEPAQEPRAPRARAPGPGHSP